MHRTEGEDYKLVGGKRLYQPANPPVNAATRLPAEAMNAIQEEICKVIEQAGMTLATGASSDTWGQLWEALTTKKIIGYAAVTDNEIYKAGQEQNWLSADDYDATGFYYIENPATNFPEIEEPYTSYSGVLHVHVSTDTDDLPYISQTMYITKRVNGGADFHCQNVYTRRFQKINSGHAWGGWVRINSFQPVRVTGLVDWNTAFNPGIYEASDFVNGPVADGVQLTVMVSGTSECITQLAMATYNASTQVGTDRLYIRQLYFTTGGYVATTWHKLFTDADVIPEANIDPVFAKKPDGVTVFELTGTSNLAPASGTTYFMAEDSNITINSTADIAIGDSCWFQASQPNTGFGECKLTFVDGHGTTASLYIKSADNASDPRIIGVSGVQLTRINTGFTYVGGVVSTY